MQEEKMPIQRAIMVPHPPLIIPEVGRGQELQIQSTIDAYHEAARAVAEAKPDTVIVLSPHTVMYADYFHISPGDGAEGSFRQSRRFQGERCPFPMTRSLSPCCAGRLRSGKSLRELWGSGTPIWTTALRFPSGF